MKTGPKEYFSGKKKKYVLNHKSTPSLQEHTPYLQSAPDKVRYIEARGGKSDSSTFYYLCNIVPLLCNSVISLRKTFVIYLRNLTPKICFCLLRWALVFFFLYVYFPSHFITNQQTEGCERLPSPRTRTHISRKMYHFTSKYQKSISNYTVRAEIDFPLSDM